MPKVKPAPHAPGQQGIPGAPPPQTEDMIGYDVKRIVTITTTARVYLKQSDANRDATTATEMAREIAADKIAGIDQGDGEPAPKEITTMRWEVSDK